MRLSPPLFAGVSQPKYQKQVPSHSIPSLTLSLLPPGMAITPDRATFSKRHQNEPRFGAIIDPKKIAYSDDRRLNVATCKQKRSGQQSTHFPASIKCNWRGCWARISCNWASNQKDRTANNGGRPGLIANEGRRAGARVSHWGIPYWSIPLETFFTSH